MKMKPIVSAKTLNVLIKNMPKYENKKNKLNAGGKREGAKSVINAMIYDLDRKEKLELIKALVLSL